LCLRAADQQEQCPKRFWHPGLDANPSTCGYFPEPRVFTVGPNRYSILDIKISSVIFQERVYLNRLGRIAISGLFAAQVLAAPNALFAGDLKIPIPQRSVSTPTQKLNREGVAELKRGNRDKAKRLFYRAYLLDAEDPFTLNNLGYVAELEGDADRALRYYALARRDNTDAIIDQSSESALKGKTLDAAFQQVQGSDREVSKINERAIVMLQNGRVFEARALLLSALPNHPHDPFLLNNLGYAMEAIGDLEGAQRSYSAAASLRSTQRVVVTPRAKWRGKPISEVAAANATAISQEIARGEGVEAATARLNLRGVAALNDNKPAAARDFFLQAYHQDPQNAFTLNNLGYISELDGDRESAESYYEAARSGRDASDHVGYSTRREAEGKKIDNLADENTRYVESSLRTMQENRRRENKPVELMHRDGSSANSPSAAPMPSIELMPSDGSSVKSPSAIPVPPIGIQAPPLPPLPPPNPDHHDLSNSNSNPPQNNPPQSAQMRPDQNNARN
jgi:Flp pilus assembly protein TadD